MDSDLALALSIQNDFDREWRELSLVPSGVGEDPPNTDEEPIIGPELEDLDPTPDLHQLFIKFDNRFFWGYLKACEVKWSPRMTLCAGVCSYRRREGLCSIRLSVPLLKLRPRKDLVETLLHEMIHAYLFVTDRNDNHDGHGPEFHKHMYRINKETGTKISVYHSFHNEVNLYKQHWWKCDGPCVNRRPFFGLVKRSMNRAPGRYDNWFAEHQRSCGGTYHKIKEPEGYGLKKKKDGKSKTNAKKIIEPPAHQDIRSLFSKQISNDKAPGKPFSGQNIVGFGGTSYASTSTKSDKWGDSETSSFKTSSLKKKNPAASSTSVSESETIKSSTSNLGAPNSNPNCDNSAQRQTVRDIWIKKFSNSGDGSTKGPLRKKFKSTFESSKSNDKPLAVDKNLSSPSLDSSVEIIEESKDANIESNTKIITQSEVPCPICNETFVERAINAHLDICLER